MRESEARAISSSADTTRFDTRANALAILLSDLAIVFQTLEPHPDTMKAYGHRIRQLLLTACMEVENGWKAVLTANLPSLPPRPSTTQYVVLKHPLRLEEWSIGLPSYPVYPEIRPFAGWNPQKAAESLPWYHAYNRTKHDRETHLKEATLAQAISAGAAALIMAAAQFGPAHWTAGWGEGPFGQHLMTFQSTPAWTPSELYYEGAKPGTWQYVPLPL